MRLRELVLAETVSLARKHRLGDLQGDADKRRESDFGHRTSCFGSKQQSRRLSRNLIVVTRMSTASKTSSFLVDMPRGKPQLIKQVGRLQSTSRNRALLSRTTGIDV